VRLLKPLPDAGLPLNVAVTPFVAALVLTLVVPATAYGLVAVELIVPPNQPVCVWVVRLAPTPAGTVAAVTGWAKP
jgi:hypothetical protein